MALPGLSPHAPELLEQLTLALKAQPADYVPRTHHLGPNGHPKYMNRLIAESSPYLLQHAHNPVNWFPWGEEAFAEARRLDRPIFLSVGYATCHWCHVMERESFEDEELAGFLNAHFVAIKVDREERPDVDGVYMTAVQLLSGGGGWPMTVFMTAGGEPFFAGTYFPARDGDRGARIGFLTLLHGIAKKWADSRDELLRDARRLSEAVAGANQPKPPEGLSGPAALVEAARFLGQLHDPVFGGFSRAPKFPRPAVHEFLLRYHRRSGDMLALQMVTHSLEMMAAGGIFDHVGGGFARYSTDERWLVPHFEKMLYDNAQLIHLLSSVHRAAASPSLERTLRETADYVLREMEAPGGGFYSATDADSEGVEGKFFVWTKEEILRALEEDGPPFAALFGVSESGNFEGKNILHRPRPAANVAAEFGLSEEELEALATVGKQRLREARSARIPPLLDDKILTEWNAQMLGALSSAGFVLDEPRYIEAARRCADVLLSRHRGSDGKLVRSWREGKASGAAVLEDYAFFVQGLLDLFEATGERRWLGAALEVAQAMNERFWDADGGGWYDTDVFGEALLVRDKPYYDGAQPAGNSEATMASLRLYAWTEDPAHRERAERTLLAFGQLLDNGAIQTPKLAAALDWRLDRAKEVVIVRTGTDRGDALVDVLRSTYVPNAVVLISDEAKLAELGSMVPWIEGKRALDGRATAYVCFEGVCKVPTSDPEVFVRQLEPEIRLEAPPIRLRRPTR